tara:strand:- start:9112 stop:9594 length:483 start_codon:yes stop_codon:yes gene_type:complete
MNTSGAVLVIQCDGQDLEQLYQALKRTSPQALTEGMQSGFANYAARQREVPIQQTVALSALLPNADVQNSVGVQEQLSNHEHAINRHHDTIGKLLLHELAEAEEETPGSMPKELTEHDLSNYGIRQGVEPAHALSETRPVGSIPVAAPVPAQYPGATQGN